MRQTSLLDSFIKKANNPTNTATKQNPNSQDTSLANNSVSKQNSQSNSKNRITQQTIQETKLKSNFDQEKLNTYRTYQKVDVVQKVQQQHMKQEDEDSQSPQLRKLKKQGKSGKSANKHKISTSKSAKNRSCKKKKNNDDEDYSEINSQSQEDFSSDEDQHNSKSLQGEDQSEDFIQMPKRKKKPQTKNQPRESKKIVLRQQTKIQMSQPVKNQEELTEQTINFDRTKFTDATPQWAIPGNLKCKDKYGVSCKQPHYDETTLNIPDYVWQQSSAPMKQYWKIKSENFDKIIFFKLGKFYQLFYEDALIGNQLLDLKWMGTKMHVGFPEKTLDKYTQELIKRGLKVVVVEQMETPEEMNNRNKEEKEKGKKVQKTLRREVTQIITKGTFQPQSDQTYLPNYLMTLYRHQELIAYSLLQIGTNSILMGIVEGFQELKTILYQTRPSQLLYDPDNLPKEWVDIMKENIDGMILSKLINKQNLWHHLNATNELQQQQQKGIIKPPQILQTIERFDFVPKNLMISTLSGLFQYLHRVYKFQYVLSTAKFKFYEREKALTHMVLDSQALQHLEIFETSAGEVGSLFDKIDRTKSKFGKRLFRRWMTSPLLNQYKINQRLDAVSDLRQLSNELQRIQSLMSKLPDLQRVCNKLYKYSVANTAAASAIYFSDLNTTRLKEFDNFMKSIQQSLMIFKLLQVHLNSLTSRRLKQLITLNNNFQSSSTADEKLIYFEDEEFCHPLDKDQQNGLLPDVLAHLHSFKQYIVWKDAKPTPKQGIIHLYDDLVKSEQLIKQRLQLALEQIRCRFNCPSISYMHVKERYEVQIPELKSIKIPQQYSFSSRKAGYSRYLVPQVQQLVSNLQAIEKGIKTQLNIFVQFFFEQFKQKQNIWEKYINILAEIDCYCSMADYSLKRKTTRPIFVQDGYSVKQAVHPALCNIDFVSNDISFDNKVILLTGPNMGGKSTILRTSCLLTIMAQMGSYVPSKSYQASIVDRIFTRIGASDKLQAGKSTFFIEMEQTKSILSYATHRSLAIIDQLGRGTATYDGMALAHSVLNFIVTKINCKCFFATHYHSLTEEFALMPGTCLKMMDYQIINGEQDRIQFLYKLVNGKAEKSFGLNVAQLVGLPKEVIQQARLKAEEMHQEIQKKKKRIKITQILERLLQTDA